MNQSVFTKTAYKYLHIFTVRVQRQKVLLRFYWTAYDKENLRELSISP